MYEVYNKYNFSLISLNIDLILEALLRIFQRNVFISHHLAPNEHH